MYQWFSGFQTFYKRDALVFEIKHLAATLKTEIINNNRRVSR